MNHYVKGCVLAIILYICHNFLSKYYLKTHDVKPDNFYNLIVAILSARENFKQRSIIRKTWISSNLKTVSSWFLIGSHSCLYPPAYRKDEFGCSELTFNLSEINSEQKLHSTHNTLLSPVKVKQAIGFGFKVHHPILLHKLGVARSFVLTNVSYSVSLVNDFTKEIVTQAKFRGSSDEIINGFVYQKVEPYTLPKNFEGLVTLETEDNAPLLDGPLAEWNTAGNVISFSKYWLKENGEIYKMPSDHQLGSTVAMTFSVLDFSKVRKHEDERQRAFSQWNERNVAIQEKLEKESAHYQDILMVNVTDVYRHLPQKLLFSFSWLQDYDIQFNFFLKTDDDAVINLEAVLGELAKLDPREKIIWGRFRHWWRVNDCGKWADLDYSGSITYPPFPCGAGYVLSKPVVSWLGANAHHLHPYQGEDVSLGIWLAALYPKRIEDPRWSCDDSCFKGSFSRAQLSPEQMHEAWTLHSSCKDICYCTS